MLNLGYAEATRDGRSARIYYDREDRPIGASQRLVNGPDGLCLTLAAGTTVRIGQGAFTATRSMTVEELAAEGIARRGDIDPLEIE